MDSLKQHMKIHAQRKGFQCTTCTKIFYRRDKKAQHEASCSRLEARKEQQQNVPFERLKAENQTGGMSKCTKWKPETTLMKPRVNEKYDLKLFLQGKRGNVLIHLERAFKEKRGVKWVITVQVKMVKYRQDGNDQFSVPFFRSNCQRLINLNELSTSMRNVWAK